MHFERIFIDCRAREIIRLVAPVRLSVCMFTLYCLACRVLRKITMTHGIAQDLRLFVSNQETFAIKSCAQRSGAFNFIEFFPAEGKMQLDVEVSLPASVMNLKRSVSCDPLTLGICIYALFLTFLIRISIPGIVLMNLKIQYRDGQGEWLDIQ